MAATATTFFKEKGEEAQKYEAQYAATMSYHNQEGACAAARRDTTGET